MKESDLLILFLYVSVVVSRVVLGYGTYIMEMILMHVIAHRN